MSHFALQSRLHPRIIRSITESEKFGIQTPGHLGDTVYVHYLNKPGSSSGSPSFFEFFEFRGNTRVRDSGTGPGNFTLFKPANWFLLSQITFLLLCRLPASRRSFLLHFKQEISLGRPLWRRPQLANSVPRRGLWLLGSSEKDIRRSSNLITLNALSDLVHPETQLLRIGRSRFWSVIRLVRGTLILRIRISYEKI